MYLQYEETVVGCPCGIVLLCLLYHKHPIYLQSYSYKSCQSYYKRKSFTFVFLPGCFVSPISRQS